MDDDRDRLVNLLRLHHYEVQSQVRLNSEHTRFYLWSSGVFSIGAAAMHGEARVAMNAIGFVLAVLGARHHATRRARAWL